MITQRKNIISDRVQKNFALTMLFLLPIFVVCFILGWVIIFSLFDDAGGPVVKSTLLGTLPFTVPPAIAWIGTLYFYAIKKYKIAFKISGIYIALVTVAYVLSFVALLAHR